MKKSVKKVLAALVVVAFAGIANAEDTDRSGKMDMNQMMDMMHDCMKMHNDGKMCESEMMSKCEKGDSKAQCKKMMKQAKAKDKSTKK